MVNLELVLQQKLIAWDHGLTLILTCLAMSIISAVRLFTISTICVGSESICLNKPPYPLSMRLLPVNWTTTTAYIWPFYCSH